MIDKIKDMLTFAQSESERLNREIDLSIVVDIWLAAFVQHRDDVGSAKFKHGEIYQTIMDDRLKYCQCCVYDYIYFDDSNGRMD